MSPPPSKMVTNRMRTVQCNEEYPDLYIGETIQRLPQRMAQHRRAKSSGQESAVYLYLKKKGHSFEDSQSWTEKRTGSKELMKLSRCSSLPFISSILKLWTVHMLTPTSEAVKPIMADMLLNLDMADGPPSGHAQQGNSKHKRFLKRRRFLEKRGLLKQKQLPQMTLNKKNEQPSNSRDHGHPNGRHWTEESRSNLFCRQPAPSSLSRRVTAGAPCQPGTLSVSSGANHPRVATITSSRGYCSPKVGTANGDGTNHPPPKPSPPQEDFSSMSEYESGFPSTPSYKIVAIDCEMVGTGLKGSISALARCSIVSYHGDVVYDKYVKPSNPVTDYRTRWSGIRREHLANAIPFIIAQKEILKVLQGKIVIGHAIQNDFKALGYFHPQEMTRDTSQISLLNRKAGFPEKEMASLKRLAKQLLRKDIQKGRGGHSSVEDAKTTMELYRIVEAEYERELAFDRVHFITF